MLRKNDAGAIAEAEEAINRNLSATFIEHTLEQQEIAALYKDSGIDVENPNKSCGLSDTLARERLELDGSNALTPPKELSNAMLLLHQFLNTFWLMLMGAGTASLIIYFIDMSVISNLFIAVVLYAVITLMCFISFFEERSARKVVRGFSKLLPTSCEVIRDGIRKTIPAEDLVVGDLVYIRIGNKVAADVRILTCNGVRLEMSSITGEPEPIEFTEKPAGKHVSIFESNNVALNGSACVDGEGLGVVIRTGDNTVLGQIAKLTTAQDDQKTLLDKEIDKFVKFLTIMGLSIAAVVFIAGIIISNFKNIFVIFINGFVSVAVANYPCGLPATLTSQMTIVARRMAKKNVLCKKLPIIETFGAATIIASDKTGTLTKNDMTVTEVWYNKHTEVVNEKEDDHDVEPKEPQSVDEVREHYTDMNESSLMKMLTVMTVCNKATKAEEEKKTAFDKAIKVEEGKKMVPSFDQPFDAVQRQLAVANTTFPPVVSIDIDHLEKEATKHKFNGSPSEVALLRYATTLVNIDKLRADREIVFEILFNSKRKWNMMITKKIDAISALERKLSCDDGEVELELMMKGAAEIIIEMCSTIATEDGEKPLDENEKQAFLDTYMHFGNEGRRVIGFATKTFKAPADIQFSMDEGNYPKSELCFLGMTAIMDPPRDTTAGAIAECKSAGIKVFMVTGDHPSTAAAIAREIGLIGDSKPAGGIRKRQSKKALDQMKIEMETKGASDFSVIRGEQLPSMSTAEWDDLLKKRAIVFARTTPEQKLLIVEQCQARGEIVVVTGDGVNDAPALKKANVGVAMGICGSEVAKQAADICLMDDNFASIVHSIKEGRTMWDNLKKTFGYTLPHLESEVLPIILNLILGMPLGITALQIITIDLGTELPPTIAYAYLKSESDIMQRPPRRVDSPLVGKGILLYSYGIAGPIMTALCVLAYLTCYWYHDINIGDLFFSATDDRWHSTAANFTSNNHTFTAEEQMQIMAQGCAAYHITVVMSQVGHFFLCTTLRTSIVQQMPSRLSILSVLIETLIVCFCVYTPGVQIVMGTAAPPGVVWLFPLAFFLIMLVINEVRKLVIRTKPHTFVGRMCTW
uniref:Cation-transporting P-type ATPase N-terminal domain-containing protein n=1 Tax=Plectus sambesii TaxID=2011161 RepID=A0A914XAW3_9BILA